MNTNIISSTCTLDSVTGKMRIPFLKAEAKLLNYRFFKNRLWISFGAADGVFNREVTLTLDGFYDVLLKTSHLFKDEDCLYVDIDDELYAVDVEQVVEMELFKQKDIEYYLLENIQYDNPVIFTPRVFQANLNKQEQEAHRRLLTRTPARYLALSDNNKCFTINYYLQ